MKLGQVIAFVDDIRPNAFTSATKTAWVNEAEGMVQTEALLWAAEEIITYDWEADQETELLVQPPHDKLYAAYVAAQIDFANGEYNRYQNDMALFNAHWGEFLRWFADVYRPADTHREVYT